MRWLAFAGWVVVGALGALTAIAILSIGIFVAPFFIIAGVVAARRTRYPLDVLGLVAGLGVPCLVVAFANRDSHPCVDVRPDHVADWIRTHGGRSASRLLASASAPTSASGFSAS